MNPNLKGMFTNVINSGSNFINTFVSSSDKESDFLYTQGYYDQMAIEDSIGRDRMRGQMAAIGTGMDYRNMLRAEARLC